MFVVSPETEALAQTLVAREPGAGRVLDKLREPLVTFAGADGFRSLLSRALSLAKRRAPALVGWNVHPDGTLMAPLEGELEGEPGLALVAHLLDLLVTFVGPNLTMQLVAGAWPEYLADSPLTEENS